jgi:UDP-N-acetylglucosamine 1-carboxyvinyltransferase
MAEKFIIKGGNILKGEIEVRGAKNATFPILAATLLTDEKCVLKNVPLVEDVLIFIEILKSLGKEINWLESRKLEIKGKTEKPNQETIDLIKKLRGSVLIMGPLLARFGHISVPQPGGCLIGARPISTHLDAFEQLGTQIEVRADKRREYFELELKKDINNKVVLNEFSVTSTENIILLASLFEKEISIHTADCDYESQELIRFLKQMGVEIEESFNHILRIKGRKNLKGAEQKIMYDPIEAGTFILMAAATKSELLIKNTEVQYLELPLKRLKDFGLPIEIVAEKTIKVYPWADLKMAKVQALPYPGIPTDLLPLFGVLATQTEGTTLIHDPLYEGRLRYLDELNKMGAQIIFADPHRAIINGPTELRGVEVNSPDLRGGASLLVGALLARGETLIDNIYQIDRGYEEIEKRLQMIGADIKRINS